MIDRDFQKQILVEMRQTYPNRFREFTNKKIGDDEKKRIAFNLKYLEEHGLIQNPFSGNHMFNSPQGALENKFTVQGEITAEGIDFLEEDGGLSAILDTVTVKLHADTIRDLIDAKIVESNAIPEQEKPALRKALKGMKEEGLKQLTTRLISYGLDQGAITAQQLGEWINS